MKWSLVTFGAGHWSWSLSTSRLRSQALRSREFADVSVKGEAWLRKKHSHIWSYAQTESGRRGYGYWRWKPHLIWETLSSTPDKSTGVVYLDAGSELNLNSKSRARLHDYFSTAEKMGPVVMSLDHRLIHWCKRETLDYFGINYQVARRLPIVESGQLVLAPTAESFDLVREWTTCADESDGFLFDDQLDSSIQLSGFREHRHDQAVLTCLMYRQGLASIPNEVYFAPTWLPDGEEFPIWSIRNKYPFSRKPGTLGERLIRVGKMVRRVARARLKGASELDSFT